MSLSVNPNGDIVTAVTPDVTYDEKFRARRLILELPSDGQYNITFEVDVQLRVDGAVVDTKHSGTLDRRFDQVVAEMQTFTDPVTGISHTLSVAGLAAGIQAAFTRWIVADR